MIDWDNLRRHHAKIKDQNILDLFESETRAEDFSVGCGNMLLDYSKTLIDPHTRALLLELAQSCDIEARREAMFAGKKINTTEKRAVLHTALRAKNLPPLLLDGSDIRLEISQIKARVVDFVRAVRAGRFQGAGAGISDVVNIGIGGSDLGPLMATKALSPYADGPRVHFVSNIDGAHIADILKDLDPARTLILVASKTFTTIETMTNAETARAWMSGAVACPAKQFVALSSSFERARDFGIPKAQIFGFEDWVGGRYSIWGPIGMSLMLSIGPDGFDDFLAGGAAMDRHFCTARLSENMPIMLALVGLWHQKICAYATRAVLPYDQRLLYFPPYIQQLEMESNGKSIGFDAQPLPQGGGPVIWGGAGTNTQHAFHQLIHQGTDIVPCEFLVAACGHESDLAHHHALLLANCFAQSEALMRGRSLAQASEGLAHRARKTIGPHRVFPGNRPSVTLIYPKLTPFALGQIIALYEHRVFVEGVVLGLNSFDQWGVELGKELASALAPAVKGGELAGSLDGSTRALISFIRAHQRAKKA